MPAHLALPAASGEIGCWPQVLTLTVGCKGLLATVCPTLQGWGRTWRFPVACDCAKIRTLWRRWKTATPMPLLTSAQPQRCWLCDGPLRVRSEGERQQNDCPTLYVLPSRSMADTTLPFSLREKPPAVCVTHKLSPALPIFP